MYYLFFLLLNIINFSICGMESKEGALSNLSEIDRGLFEYLKNWSEKENPIADITKFLETGANINVRGQDSKTPLSYILMFAEGRQEPYDTRDRQKEADEMINFFINKGADVNASDIDGISLLHGAAEKTYPVMLGTLLKAGANIFAVDNLGNTPLHKSTNLNYHVKIPQIFQYAHYNEPRLIDNENKNRTKIALWWKYCPLPSDLKLQILTHITEEVCWTSLLTKIIKIADKEQLRKIAWKCPFIQIKKSIRNLDKKYLPQVENLAKEIVDYRIMKGNELLKIKNSNHETAIEYSTLFYPGSSLVNRVKVLLDIVFHLDKIQFEIEDEFGKLGFKPLDLFS